MTELTLLIGSQFSHRLNFYEMLWQYIDKSRLQGIPQSSLYQIAQIHHSEPQKRQYTATFSILPYISLYFEHKQTHCLYGPPVMPFLVFQRDHLRPTSGIICGSGSFAVQFGGHFRSGDHLRSGVICGAVPIYIFEISPFPPSFVCTGTVVGLGFS